VVIKASLIHTDPDEVSNVWSLIHTDPIGDLKYHDILKPFLG
jgi:hypothetical protein